MALSFQNVRYGGKALKTIGILRLNENGFGWKNKTGKSIAILKNDIERIEWISVGKGRGQLRIFSEGSLHMFDGIPPQDLDSVKQSVSSFFSQEVEDMSLSTTGWNWGETSFQGPWMNFSVGGAKAFDIPLAIVEQAHNDNNDLVIAFHQDNTTNLEGVETLTEMRFWIPNTEPEGSKHTSSEKMLEKVLSNADILSAKGTGMVTFSQIGVKTPRGRYDIEIFPSFLRMKGTQSSTITYDCITRLTCLKTPDEKDYIIIISLDPPLRRGHTSYPHILMQVPTQATLEVELSLTNEQEEKYRGKLEKTMSGNKFELIKQVFQVVTGIKTTKLGNFRSKGDGKAVRCSMKAHDGYLYLLAKCFFFVYNPLTFISFDSILHVEFARLGTVSTQASRTFDLVIFAKQSAGANFVFSSIAKDEYEPLKKYLHAQGVSIKQSSNIEAETSQTALDTRLAAAMMGDESEDEDFSSGEDSEAPEDFEPDSGSIGDLETLDDEDDEAFDGVIEDVPHDGEIKSSRSKEKSKSPSKTDSNLTKRKRSQSPPANPAKKPKL